MALEADLARAYRQLRVCLLSTPLLGVSLDNKFYIYIAPPFGCCTSALACARNTYVVVWLLRQEGLYVLCYLDDFVELEATHERAVEAYAQFNQLTCNLGLALAKDKCTPPNQTLTLLEFVVNTRHMLVTLPVEKVLEVLAEYNTWKKKVAATCNQLQSLAGRLQHLSKCIKLATRLSNRVLAAL